MNTKQFTYALVLAQEGSFSRAAEVLNISQPSLSQYIIKIEKELGIKLFDRANGDVRITDAGRVYIEAGRKILDIERQMQNAFVDFASYKAGSLRIGAAPYRAASMLPRIAGAFQALHPGMYLVVREGTTAELVEGVEHGEYDMALTLLPVDERAFSIERVVEEELILAVPNGCEDLPAVSVSGHKYAAVKVETLNDRRFVMLTDAQFMQKQLEHVCADHQIRIRPAAVVKSLEAQIEMVKAGVGMALVPSGIEGFCRPGEVKFYSFDEDLPKREVVIIWRKDRKLSTVEEELKNLILSIGW